MTAFQCLRCEKTADSWLNLRAHLASAHMLSDASLELARLLTVTRADSSRVKRDRKRNRNNQGQKKLNAPKLQSNRLVLDQEKGMSLIEPKSKQDFSMPTNYVFGSIYDLKSSKVFDSPSITHPLSNSSCFDLSLSAIHELNKCRAKRQRRALNSLSIKGAQILAQAGKFNKMVQSEGLEIPAENIRPMEQQQHFRPWE